MLKKLICFLFGHDYVVEIISFGPVSRLIGKMLMHHNLLVRDEVVDGIYYEHWLKCKRCKLERPRYKQKDVYDVE